MASSGIDSNTAALLSRAAYTSLGDWEKAAAGQAVDLPTRPPGWQVDIANSGQSDDKNNQFITFVNDATGEVVPTFKGTDTLSQAGSVFGNTGYSAWKDIQPVFAAQLDAMREQYPGYQIMTNGHSLGGGMSATAALTYGLSGYEKTRGTLLEKPGGRCCGKTRGTLLHTMHNS
jgi:hypothetical protein